MYICICNAIKDSQIEQALHEGKLSISELRQHLAFASRCGKCTSAMRDMLKEHLKATGIRADD